MGEDLSVDEFNKVVAENQVYQEKIRQRKEAREKRLAYLDELSKPLLDELREQGVDVVRITRLANYTPLSPAIATTLVKWLENDLDDELDRDILLLLQQVKHQYDGRPLARLFEKNERVRIPVADTISEALPTGISDWAVSAISNPAYGDGRLYLAKAVAKLAPHETATATLLPLFDEDPSIIGEALGHCGGENEKSFLEARVRFLKGDAKKVIEKSIKQLKKRLAIP